MSKLAYASEAHMQEPLSTTCEHMPRGSAACGKPTCYAYPAMGRGWMALCHEHGQKHLPHAHHVTTLVLAGVKLRPLASEQQPQTPLS